MSLVPLNPKFTAEAPDGVVIPEATMPVFTMPQNMTEADMTPEKTSAIRSMLALSASNQIMTEQQQQQLARVEDRCSTEQWLDENEREWYAMDSMIRSRPWALRKDEPFPYPFKKATNDMRQAEGPWLGDLKDNPAERAWTRSKTIGSHVLKNIRPVAEHPPFRRVILFTPEFGSESSFDPAAWMKLEPISTCDMWTASWQGWTDFDEMIEQLLHRVLSFADAVSTVWVGHGTGALVAYELLKRFEQHHSPNLPVALLVSGCPAPHLFQTEFRPEEKFSFLSQLQTEADFAVLTPEQIETLQRQFQVATSHKVDQFTLTSLQRGLAPDSIKDKFAKSAELSAAQKEAIVGDLKLIRSYQFKHEQKRELVIPVAAMCHDEDPLVSDTSVQEWAAYTAPGSDFKFVHLEDIAEDSDLLPKQGHGYTMSPVPEVIQTVVDLCEKHQLIKEVDDMLPDPGPVDGEMPAEVDCFVVGAGIAGICGAKALVETGKSVVVVDRYRTIGGIWMFYANNFSRVNSSEPAYRICNQEGPASRPNEDHSPRHDILRDIFTVANKYLYGKVRCRKDVIKVDKRADGTFDVQVKDLDTGKVSTTHAKYVTFHVNRRIGKRRNITWDNQKAYRGKEVYGYANEVIGLKFWNKKVIVVGAGAFAFENLRTALEHGARHCTILGRRAGTTCPKWIDMIAFLRPLDPYFNTNKNGNIISFDVWRRCYEDAGLRTPECWEEGLLKPHNHTVSVSDLAFIGGYHGMVDLRVGEIARFNDDGHGVTLKDGGVIEVDIIIKATGFHLNDEVPQITGYSKIHSFGLMDMNLNYGAEPLLDGGQFGSSKGKVADGREELDQMAVYQGVQESTRLGLPDLTPKANPFGSAYVGGMLSSAYLFKWFVENEDYQKDLLKTTGAPEQSCVETWVSQIGSNSVRTIQKLLTALK